MATAEFLGQMPETSSQAAEQAVLRLDATDQRKRKSVAKPLLWIVLGIVSSFILWDAIQLFRNYSNSISGPAFSDLLFSSPLPTDESTASRLSKKDALLVFGDLSQTSKTDQLKGLWDSNPLNPAFFADYTNAYIYENHSLPPNFLETARRIDPDNAWFIYVAAGFRAKETVKKRAQSTKQVKAREAPEWDIVDPVKFEEALALLREARDQPECENYAPFLHRQRIRILPQETPPEKLFTISYVAGQNTGGEISLAGLSNVLAAKLWQCGKQNDKTGFGEWLFDAESFLVKRSRQEVGSLISEFINKSFVSALATQATPVAAQFGMEEQSARLASMLDEVHQMKARMESRDRHPNVEMVYRKGGSILPFLSPSYSKHLKNPPLLSESEVAPGRLADHHSQRWIETYLIWSFLLAISVGAAIYRFRAPPLIRLLSRRLIMLLRPSDWICILCLGILAPLTIFALVTLFTPMGGLGMSLMSTEVSFPYDIDLDPVPLPLLQFTTAGLLVILLPSMIIRWRIHHRLAAFGTIRRLSPAVVIAAISVTLFIPAMGLATISLSKSGTYFAWGIALVTLCMLGVVGYKILLVSRPRDLLQYYMISRCLVPVGAFAALMVISSAPFFKMAAYEWIRQDPMIRMDPDLPVMTPLEGRITTQLRKELLEIPGFPR